MAQTLSSFLLSAIGTLFLVSIVGTASSIPQQHAVEFANDSGQQLVLDWFNPVTKEKVEFYHLSANEKISVNSFANHTFLLRIDNETCSRDQACRSAIVTISDDDDQVVKLKDNLEVEITDHQHNLEAAVESNESAEEIVRRCRQVSEARLKAGHESKEVMKTMLACVEAATADKIQELRTEELFQAQLRQKVSSLAENYTCGDSNMETTKATEFREWNYENSTRRIHLLHERQASKIHLLENFISPEECAAIQEAAAPKLHHGTVADGKGGSKLSDHRKAMQAGVRVPWEKEEEGDLITRVFRRIYAYTNDATGLGLEVDGQEDIMSIQYFGRGKNDTAPDRYMPHCDGDCNGLPHKKGGRVATMVMYCTAENLVGGATNFGHANVFVKPKVGAAAFFSYLDADTHIHETGFTTHSGCPVVEGVKRIAVHWMRVGVSKEHPWDSFNTNNILKSECDDGEY